MNWFARSLCWSALAVAPWSAGCKTTSSLEANQPASLMRLDEKFQIFARLGDLPVPIKDTEPVARYAVSPKGRSAEYLIMVSPGVLEGKLELPIKETGDTVASAVQYNAYLDRILRVHRLVLRGQLTEAKKIVEGLDATYEPTFGSLMLSGNIAFLERRFEDAARLYAEAARVYPEAQSLKNVGVEAK